MEQSGREALKEIIENEGHDQYDDMMTAKDNIDVLAKDVSKRFLISTAHFKKLVKLNYEKSIEVERHKFSELDELYIEIFGEPEPEPDLFHKKFMNEDADPINDTIDKDEILDKIKYGAKRNKNNG